VKRIYALSGGNKELCLKVIASHGYTSSKEVMRKDYDAICEEIVELRGEE